MFRFLLGEIAVCMFLVALLGTVVLALFLAGYMGKYLVLLSIALLLPLAHMLTKAAVPPVSQHPIVVTPLPDVLAECLP